MENNQIKKEYPKVVLEIHNEFMNAGDKILEMAKVAIKESEDKSVKKGLRLRNLGFLKTKESELAEQKTTRAKTLEESSILVVDYSVKYPLNKFITEEQVGKICGKYNLVCGDIDRFKGFVPEIKLEEIENFTSKYNFDHLWRVGDIILDMSNYVIGSKTDGYSHFFHKSDRFHKTRIFQRNDGDNDGGFYADGVVNGTYYNLTSMRTGRLNPTKLKICAPLKDMDTTGLRLNGYTLEHIPDPVVLQPVRGGYLVITAWGDEASDEIVVNQILN